MRGLCVYFPHAVRPAGLTILNLVSLDNPSQGTSAAEDNGANVRKGMAEIIGLASGILTLAGVAAKISIGLYQISSDIGSAGKDVRLIAADTNAFAQTLTNLSQVLSAGDAKTERARTIAKGLIVLCKEILDDSAMLLEALQPLVKLTGRRWKRGALRVRWLFEKSKFAIHRESLEALKSSLTLLVATMNYVNGTSADLPQFVNNSLQAQLESIREEVRLSTKDYEVLLLKIQNELQTMRSDALLTYAKIDQETEDGGVTESSLTIPKEDESEEEFYSQDEIAVSPGALAITTGLAGLPYLRRQAVHLADDALDELQGERESLDKYSSSSSSTQLSVSHHSIAQAVHKSVKGQANVLEIGADLASAYAKLSLNRDNTFQQAAKEVQYFDNTAMKDYERATAEAKGKVAFANFKVGDLALFLPTRNSETRAWAAFNVDFPHRFLHSRPEFKLERREWLIARITAIEERIVDVLQDAEDNPYDLSDGLKWWLLDAELLND